MVAPGLGHPWPLVIGRHPWPSGDILGCCHRPSALPPALLTSALVPRAPGSASGRGSASASAECQCQHQCTSPVISSATSPAHQCICIQSTGAPVSVPAERVAKRAQGRRGEGADLQHLGVTVRPGPDQGAAIKGIPPMMRVSPAVEVRADPDITIYTATGVAILVFVNLSL